MLHCLLKSGYTVQSFRAQALISLKSWKNWVLKWSFGKSTVGVGSGFKSINFQQFIFVNLPFTLTHLLTSVREPMSELKSSVP